MREPEKTPPGQALTLPANTVLSWKGLTGVTLAYLASVSAKKVTPRVSVKELYVFFVLSTPYSSLFIDA